MTHTYSVNLTWVNNGNYSSLWVPWRFHMTSCHLACLSSAFLSRPEMAAAYIYSTTQYDFLHVFNQLSQGHAHFHSCASHSHLLTCWPLFLSLVFCFSPISLLGGVASIHLHHPHAPSPLRSAMVVPLPPLHSTPLNLEWTYCPV